MIVVAARFIFVPPTLIQISRRFAIGKDMSGMNGFEATRQIRTAVKVLVLTTYDDDEWVCDATRAGAFGYLLKDTSCEAVIQTIRGIVL